MGCHCLPLKSTGACISPEREQHTCVDSSKSVPVLGGEGLSLGVEAAVDHPEQVMLTQSSLSQSHGAQAGWLRGVGAKSKVSFSRNILENSQVKNNIKESVQEVSGTRGNAKCLLYL